MGHHNRVFTGDASALHGAWSPPNSAANFCEEDYVVTRWVAEFINSLTNLAYVFFALRYMYGPGSRGLLSPRLDFMSVSILFVGVGSFLFHATLWQSLQFVDDLSMLVLGGSMLHGVFTVRQSPSQRRVTSLVLGVVVVGFSAFYVWSGKIIYHLLAFTSQMLLILFRCIYLLQWDAARFPDHKLRSWRFGQRGAIAVFLLGYLLWNIDLEYCAELRVLRAQVGVPWAFGLELHGWWHILTAAGADMFIRVVRDIHDWEERGKGRAAERKDE